MRLAVRHIDHLLGADLGALAAADAQRLFTAGLGAAHWVKAGSSGFKKPGKRAEKFMLPV